jgi:hypothetical protein
MDQKTRKRIDSLYRNVKQIPILGAIGLFMPLFALITGPLALAYLYLRSKLLSEIDRGVIDIDAIAQGEPLRPGEPSTWWKVEYLRHHSIGLWATLAMAAVWIIPTIVLVIYLSLPK